MGGLSNDKERALAWKACWDPAFSGIAIVNEDFTFRSVNQQFCEIVGVTPGDLIEKNFKDITPEPLKSLDAKNAKLVKDGIINSYFLPKTYEFPSGKRVDVNLLVVGVYEEETGEFLFFVSRIMEKIISPTSNTQSQKQTGFLDNLDKKKIGTAITTLLIALLTLITALVSNINE